MIIPIAIFLFILIACIIGTPHDRGEGALVGMACGVIASIIISGLVYGGILISTATTNDAVIQKSWDIVSVGDGTGTKGRFGLFSGYINEEIRYYYYYPTANGYKQSWIAGNVKIVEDAPGPNGYILQFGEPTHDLMPWLPPASFESDYYEIHVPEGTVVQQMVLDTSAQ